MPSSIRVRSSCRKTISKIVTNIMSTICSPSTSLPLLSLSLFFFDFLLTSRRESYSFFSKKERRELSPSTSLCRRTKVPESQRTKSVSRSLWDTEERFAGMGSKKADHYPLVLHWSRYPMQPRLQRLSSLLYYNRDSVRCWTLGATAVLKPIRV